MTKLDPARLQEIREQISFLRPGDFEFSADWELAVSCRDLLGHIAALETELEDTRAAAQLAQRQLDACRKGRGTYEGITR